MVSTSQSGSSSFSWASGDSLLRLSSRVEAQEAIAVIDAGGGRADSGEEDEEGCTR